MIEWCASSYFSFLEGASSPTDLIQTAHSLGYTGLGLADRMGQYGQVQALRGRDSLPHPLSHRLAHSVGEHAGENPHFFFAPGIRLHFDAADPLIVYPLHKKSYGSLNKFLSNWALDGMKTHEKGLTPLPWKAFIAFLKKEKLQAPLETSYLLISINGRFYPWVEQGLATNRPQIKKQTQKKKKLEPSRLQAQEARAPTPSFANPPTSPGFCPLWLLELASLCEREKSSALALAYPLTSSPGCEDLILWLEEQSRKLRIPLLATTLPLYATLQDQELCDLLAAIRHTCELKNLGYLAQANGERRLLNIKERAFHEKRLLERLKEGWLINNPIAHSQELATRHHFSLMELNYRYPEENIPPSHTATSWLRELVERGAHQRYGEIIPPKVSAQIAHELKLISQLQYEDYFLTIWEILGYAREQKILFQGRGSAANSAVCFCLGITSIDPTRIDLLFERFLSVERHEPPDIDVDFEHERREEVMQEVYRRYGRNKAAMVSSYICFRGRMAARETAKALGLSKETTDDIIRLLGREGLKRVTQTSESEDSERLKRDILKKHKISERTWRRLCKLSPQLVGLPRHLGLHTGGFILSSNPLDEQCVLEPARMQNRSVIPWNKDDVDYLKWMKVDLLSLGMLTAIRKTFEALKTFHNKELDLKSVPAECPKVYTALCRADTVGVFQIESRAQMNMLPRLAPHNFYDLVIEVAIVRPGPIQGGMVHPYLKRRQNPELVVYDHPKLEPILKKTLGVPIFQEQVMKMAEAIAGFTPGEADQLRKVMSGAWRSKSHMSQLRNKLIAGMTANGITGEFAERVYKQIEGFGDYGFPESHAASFAILTYVSSYLKVHHPSEFLLSLLNSQPMGFYSPRALIHDAERHGIRVLPVDLCASSWNCTLEDNPANPERPFVRMGLRLIRGFSEKEALTLELLQRKGVLSTEHERIPSLKELHRDYGIERKTLEKLIRAGALQKYGHTRDNNTQDTNQDTNKDNRRNNLWELFSLKREDHAQTKLSLSQEPASQEFLHKLSSWESLIQDYASTGLTPKSLSWRSDEHYHHPAQFARCEFFAKEAWLKAADLFLLPENSGVKVIGLLSAKQKPPTASGLVFVTLEDETGFFNLVLMPDVYEKTRLILESGSILAAQGLLQKSRPALPADPRSVALSLKISKLWNPFLTPNHENPAASPPTTKTRSWH